MPNFTDETIERIFGADDAENETPERFIAYFYYNQAYESLISSLPIRVLVGHKGVGKSALLKRAYLADQEAKRPCVWLRPNDLVSIKQSASGVDDFILRIETWKEGILREVLHHVLISAYGEGSAVVAPELEAGRTRGLMKVLSRALSEGYNGVDGSVRYVTIYIDDIDRGWSAAPDDIKNISALLNAMRDIAGENQNIRFRIGLRSDVYS